MKKTLSFMFAVLMICSLVQPAFAEQEADVEPQSTTYACAQCLIETAKGELGYEEGNNGYTKYGSWFDSRFDGGYECADWCAMFVCWCANQAGISTSVIPTSQGMADVAGLLKYYDNKGLAFRPSAKTPKAGDLFFEDGVYNNPGHVGIVISVSSTTITVIAGNTSQDNVAMRTISRSNNTLVAFARPAYQATSHNYKTIKDASGNILYYKCSFCGYRVNFTSEISRIVYTPEIA